MTRTEHLILSTIQRATPVIRAISRRTPSLAKQAERAMHSVALQYAEGIHARGGNRDAKLQGAYAEAKEAMTAMRVAGSTDGAREPLEGHRRRGHGAEMRMRAREPGDGRAGRGTSGRGPGSFPGPDIPGEMSCYSTKTGTHRWRLRPRIM